MSELAAEKYLKQIAKEKGVTPARAAELMDICLKMTSAQLGIPFSDVYATIYNTDYMSRSIKVKCNELDLDECGVNTGTCVIFDGVCVSRYFKDAEKMNADPDKYVEGMPTDVLAGIVKLAAYLYYNYDGGGLTDNTFDALEYHIQKRLKARGRLYEKIGAPPIDKIRVKLPYPLPSLDKIKPGSRELFEFLLAAAKPKEKGDRSPPIGIAWSLKLDGVSGMLVYSKGSLKGIFTRGDGAIGGDVMYLKDYIKFPKISPDSPYKDIVVRGEFILSKKLWEEKYKGSYSNARSFASAKINSGHVSQGMNDLSFIAYEIMTFGNNTETPEATKSFSILNALGFEVVDSGFLATPTIFDIITLYKSKRESSLYSIDGLVLSLNIPKPPIKQGVINPTHTVAFKMRLEEQIRKTKVLNVEWNISRYGRLVPVVSYESVYVDGIRMHRASGHNAAHIRDWSLGKGSIIKVVRSGDVIPTIIDCEVNEAIEPIFPNLIPSWHWKGNDIYLDDIDGNRTVQIMRMNHFFATIGVPRLREKTLEKLWNFGLKDIKAITNAKPSDFIKIKGIGKKSAEGHYRNIHEVMRKTRLDRFIPAVTSTTLGIGRKLVKQLMRYHPSILEDEEDVIRRMLTKKKIPGFGPKRIESVASNIPKFKEFLFSLNEEDIKYAIKQDKEQRERIKAVGYNQKIRGKMFVTTGFFGHMDIELEDYIYDNLGNFSDLVTSGTTAVIAANLLSSSKKMVAALQLNIPVLSLQEFVKSFDIPYAKLKDDEDPDADIVSKDPEDREE